MEDRPNIAVTIFIRPDGKSKEAIIYNINKEDADYINVNKIKVSMEDTGDFFIIWFDDGKLNEENEPDEIIVLSRNRTCQECIREGIELLKARKHE